MRPRDCLLIIIVTLNAGCAVVPRQGMQLDLGCRHTKAPDDWQHLRCSKKDMIHFTWSVR